MHTCLSYQPTKNHHPILKPFPTAPSSPSVHVNKPIQTDYFRSRWTKSVWPTVLYMDRHWSVRTEFFAKFCPWKTSFWRRTRLSIVPKFTHLPSWPRSMDIPLPHFLSSQQGACGIQEASTVVFDTRGKPVAKREWIPETDTSCLSKFIFWAQLTFFACFIVHSWPYDARSAPCR